MSTSGNKSKKKGNGSGSSGRPDRFSVNVKIKLLKNSFPDLSDAACEDLLYNCHWRVEDAKSYLSNNRIKLADDRTYTPRQSREFDSFVFDVSNWVDVSPTEADFMNNSGYKTYPPSTSDPIPSLFGASALIKPKSKSLPKDCVQLMSNSEKEDWEFVFKQMSCDHRKPFLNDLRRQLDDCDFAKVLWKICPYPGKRIPKTLILLRGVPGSGKSTLASLIINSCGGRSLSADDFFTDRTGKYSFDFQKLPDAHASNQRNCASAMKKTVTPIIIDNTNTQTWEMLPYIKMAIENDYFIEILEPTTTWRRNAKTLAVKTIHSVPRKKIEEMLNRFETNITVPNLVHQAGYNYEDYLRKIQKSGYLPNSNEQLSDNFGLLRIDSHEDSLEYSLRASKPGSPSRVTFDMNDHGCRATAIMNVTTQGLRNVSWNGIEGRKRYGNENTDLIQFTDVGQMNEEMTGQKSESHKSVAAVDFHDKEALEAGPCKPVNDLLNDSESRTSFAENLRTIFPDLSMDVIDDIISSSNGDLNWASDVLFDEEINSILSISEKDFASINQKKDIPSPSFGQSTPRTPTASGLNQDDGTERLSCDNDTNSPFASLACYWNGDTDTAAAQDNKNIALGQQRSQDFNATNSKSLNGDVSDDSDNSDLFVPIDGHDWFDMQLDKNLVETLTQTYCGYKPATHELDSTSLKIRIPPKMAFKLFQYYTLGLMENASSEPGADRKTEAIADPVVNDLVEMDEITSSVAPNFKKLMEVEARLLARDKQDLDEIRSKIPPTMASKLAIDELQTNFPKVPRSEIEFVYAISAYSFDKSLERLMTSFPDKMKKPETTITKGLKDNNSSRNVSQQTQELSPPMSPAELREIAYTHHRMRQDYANQLTSCRDKRAKVHYYDRYNYHTEKMKEFNNLAADAISVQFYKRNGNGNDLDLHHLYVQEALQKLKEHLEERRQSMRRKGLRKMELRIITGRGKNSINGEARIAPAVMTYLKNKHYSFLDCNGSVLVVLRSTDF